VPQLSAGPLGCTGSALRVICFNVLWLPIWFGNRFLLALVFISVVQTQKFIAFYKVVLSTSFVLYENTKAVQVK
jgi:hypothetical protein